MTRKVGFYKYFKEMKFWITFLHLLSNHPAILCSVFVFREVKGLNHPSLARKNVQQFASKFL